MTWWDDCRDDLKRDEGLVLVPYSDVDGQPVMDPRGGKITIGYGRNLEDRGITEATASALLGEDMAVASGDLDRNAPWWTTMPDNARRGLLNMCFNLGWPALSGFRNMLAALEAGAYATAADEALDSRWARQVGPRAERIAALYRSCEVA